MACQRLAGAARATAMIEPDNRLVTVFGGGGFIGRYVCEQLLDADVRLRVASRAPRTADFLQPLAQIGQWGLVRADITRPESVRAAVAGASAVINLCGAFKNMAAVHATGAGYVAEAARDAGARALVHISAIGADAKGQSRYASTKGEGENEVRSAFPGATIIRPSLVFGSEDNLTNRLARLGWLPVLPVIAPDCRFQPVYVDDLAKAIAAAALDPTAHGGKTYEIGGPQVMTMRELTAIVLDAAGRDPALVDMPDFAASLLSWLGFLPGAPLTRDQWLMLQNDNVPSGEFKGFEAFGISPAPLAAIAPAWLGRFRRGGRFAMRSSGRAA